MARVKTDLRVTLVTPSYLPTVGGMELHVMHLAESFVRRGWRVRVVTKKTPHSRVRQIIRGVDVERIHPVSLPAALANADVIHAHGARSVFSAIALAIASKSCAKVFTPHCYYPPTSGVGRIKRRVFDPTLGRAALRAADRVIALTERGKEEVLEQGGEEHQIVVVPNAVDFAGNDSALNLAETASALPDDYVLFTGRLDANKNVRFLIEAMPSLRQRGLQAVIIGPDGGTLGHLTTLVSHLGMEDVVHFRGRVAHSDLIRAVKGARVVVLPSHYEGMPTSLIEAAGLGTPVVASAVGGTPWLLRQLPTGYTYEAGDHASFLIAMDAALSSEPAAIRATEMVARDRYSWNAVVEQIYEVYKEIV